MASKMQNWINYQQGYLTPEAFEAWKAGNVKVQSFLRKQDRVPTVIRNLDSLQKDILTKVMGPALERASNYLATIEKAGASGLSKTGILAQSIGSTKAKLYPATFCGYCASGPRRGFARAVQLKTRNGVSKLKRLSKKSTLAIAAANLGGLASAYDVKNPVAYARYLRHGRKQITAGQAGSGKRALVSAAGEFFGHKVRAAAQRDFMANAEAASESAANIATCEMQLNLQKLLPE